jgi:hypothetical protein
MSLSVLQLAIAALAAGIALFTYWRSTRTKAAELLARLHKDFFVDTTYKAVRKVMDDDGESADSMLERYIQEQPAEFTDFLNFFELVAYMGSRYRPFGKRWLSWFGSRMLSPADVNALLNYYLRLFLCKPALCTYIEDPANDFEHLDRLLKRRKKQKGR